MDTVVEGSLRGAGALLLLGGALAIAGAFTPPYKQWSSPPLEALRIIAAHPTGWRLIHLGFFSGTIGSALGLALLAAKLHGRPGGDIALVTAGAYGLASIPWIVNLCIRVSATRWAADELVATGAIPPTYAPWRAFLAMTFVSFSALAYASVAGLGWTILRSAIAPTWSGWLFVVWGLSAGFVFGANVPFIAYVPFVVLGGFLIRGG